MNLEVLYPAISVSRKKPNNLVSEDDFLFDREYYKELSEVTVSFFQEAIIQSDSFTYKYENNRYKSLIDGVRIRFADKIKIFLNRALGVKRINQQCMFITGQWSEGYFHWMTDCLTKIVACYSKLENPLIILPYYLRDYEFVNQTLSTLKIRHTYFPKHSVWLLKSLLIPSFTAPTGNYYPLIVQSLRTQFLSKVDRANDNNSRRIYISRQKAKKRKVVNEKQLIPILISKGFEILYLEEVPWVDQLGIFSSCNILVSIHGAGLTNMLFMKPNSSVLELRLKGDSHNNCYFSMASALDVNYYYQTCPGTNDQTQFADLTVNPERFEKNLALIIEQL